MRFVVTLIALLLILLVIYVFVNWLTAELNIGSVFAPPGGRITRETLDRSGSGEPRASVERDGSQFTLQFEKSSPLQPKPPEGFEASDLSLYYGFVHLGSVRRPSFSSGGGFAIRADSVLKDAVDITDWKIKSNEGEISIRGSTAVTGPVNRSIIVLRPNAAATFYAGENSSIKNIELNKCTGYLNNTYKVDPKLPNQCPRPARSKIINFSGECQSFILSLSSCEMPTALELNRFTGTDDIDCHEFLEDLNYQNCSNTHQGEVNFFDGWRVWIAERLSFDSAHDRLLLFDQNNLVVDEYVY